MKVAFHTELPKDSKGEEKKLKCGMFVQEWSYQNLMIIC